MLMLPDNAPPSRSEQLESIAKQADAHIYHGFELANRNASFAARSEFIAALRLIAQGLDTENRTTTHSRALSAGLTAIKEADDFIPSGTKLEAELDLAVIIGSHRTPVLKNASADADDLRPMTAVKCYFTFAQEQMAAAAGHEVAGSMALRALGKLHATLARQRSLEVKLTEPKAMVYFQSALLVFPQNYMASNDLGVLLAQCGNYAEAKRTLEHSVSIYRSAENLNNLATVYRQLGQTGLAATTQQQADLARNIQMARLKNRQASADGSVQWVSPPVLAQTNESPTIATQPRPAQTSTVKPNPSTPAAQPTASVSPKQPSGEKPNASSNSSAVGWLPSIFGQPKAR
jgi:tetratricopeptide (TPR) repeat protein